MTIDSNDPRLTAYVLGELDEVERGEIDAALADDSTANRSELRETLAQLRAASDLLLAALDGRSVGGSLANAVDGASNSGGSDDVSQSPTSVRPAIVAQAKDKADGVPAGRRRRRYVVLALAAIVLLAITIPLNLALQSESVATLLFSNQSSSKVVERLAVVDEVQRRVGAGGSREESQQSGVTDRDPLNLAARREPTTSHATTESTHSGNVFASGSGEVVFDQVARPQGGVSVELFDPAQQQAGKLQDDELQAGGQQGTGQQNNPQWHYGYVPSGDMNGDALPNFGLKVDLNAHGGVPGQSGQTEKARADVDRRFRESGGERFVQALGDLMEGEAGDANEAREALNEALALRGELKPEALKKLQEVQQQVAEDRAHNTEAYARIYDNRFLRPLDAPLSTFSIDVDTAAYANMRRFLKQGSLPPADSVRIEELVNYFSYQYAPPAEQDADKPFAVHTEVTACPWNPGHRLVRIALKGREIKVDARPPSNLVFLLDVSGSMDEPNKLPLVKRAMHLLVEKLGENDRVAIVVYAGASGLVLPSTTANNRETILAAIDNLTPGGSTNGASGIELAYQIAAANQIKEGVNRVILATDGDFNVGVTNDGDLTRLIEDKAKSGVFLTVLGFGMGNLKDSTLERLADKGNGNYGYIDTENEARKLLVEQLSGTLITIAKDVKLQIEFNPARVAAYRLLGYENRLLAAEDFNDDTKDAGEIGAGHAVTAFYEIVPVAPPAPEQPVADKPADNKPVEAAPAETTPVDPLKYQRPAELTDAARGTPELLTLKLRYKEPEGTTSKLLEFGVADGDKPIGQATEDTRFAASVALFGMLLRQSPHTGSGTLAAVLEMADSSRQADEHGYRAEFVELVKQAMTLAQPRP